MQKTYTNEVASSANQCLLFVNVKNKCQWIVPVRQLMQRGHLKDWCQPVCQQMPNWSAKNTSRPRYLKLSECQQIAQTLVPASAHQYHLLLTSECRRLVWKAGAKDKYQIKYEDQDHQLVLASTN